MKGKLTVGITVAVIGAVLLAIRYDGNNWYTEMEFDFGTGQEASQVVTGNENTGYTDEFMYYDTFKVVDGDTVKIRSGNVWKSIRMIGIDAPESSRHRYGYTECFSGESKEQLVSLLSGHSIRLMYDESIGVRDPYDRILAYVITDSGDNVNTLMVQGGYAKIYDNDHKYHVEYDYYQEVAMGSGLGLWGACTGLSLDGN